MTSHKEALEAACAAVVLGTDKDGNQVHLSPAEADLAISSYLSALSPDVSGLVERLRKVSSTLKEYGWGDVMVDPPKEAADALASLSLQLAAVEGERDNALEQVTAAVDDYNDALKSGDTQLMASLSAVQEELAANIKARNDFARECGRSWEENERLRKALGLIAHTCTEDSHGNTKDFHGGYYRGIARTALAATEGATE